MNKNNILIIIGITIVIMVTFFIAETHASKEVGDNIKMENKAYSKHTKSIQTFSHKKHAVEYAEKHPYFYEKGCGECHHDKDSVPLCNLKEGDEVQNCIECHKKAGYIKGKKAKGLTKKQRREYHANAIHDNCKECHKNFNKMVGLKSKDKGAAPVTCKQCHPKN